MLCYYQSAIQDSLTTGRQTTSQTRRGAMTQTDQRTLLIGGPVWMGRTAPGTSVGGGFVPTVCQTGAVASAAVSDAEARGPTLSPPHRSSASHSIIHRCVKTATAQYNSTSHATTAAAAASNTATYLSTCRYPCLLL